jgi:hypothetical protein
VCTYKEDFMATVEQRVSGIEAVLPHLATKADLAELETRLTREMGNQLRWMVGILFGGMTAAAGIAVTVSKLLG